MRISTCSYGNKYILIKKTSRIPQHAGWDRLFATQILLPAKYDAHLYICQLYTADQVLFVLHSKTSSEGGTELSSTHVVSYVIHSLCKIPKGGALGNIIVPAFFHDSINLEKKKRKFLVGKQILQIVKSYSELVQITCNFTFYFQATVAQECARSHAVPMSLSSWFLQF